MLRGFSCLRLKTYHTWRASLVKRFGFELSHPHLEGNAGLGAKTKGILRFTDCGSIRSSSQAMLVAFHCIAILPKRRKTDKSVKRAPTPCETI